MSYLLAIPVTILLLILQTTLGSQVNLLSGNADFLLVWLVGWGLFSKDQSVWFWVLAFGLAISYVSALPWYVTLVAYLLVTMIARFVQSRLWQTPLMSMFVIILTGSIFLYLLSYVGLMINGYSFDFQETLVQIIIPSVFMNLFLGLLFYPLVRDTAAWVQKREVD